MSIWKKATANEKYLNAILYIITSTGVKI
jgi:hypothetical protein